MEAEQVFKDRLVLPEAKKAWFLLFRELYTSDSLPGNELTGHFPSLVHSIACVV
jgi:hypothetical protein